MLKHRTTSRIPSFLRVAAGAGLLITAACTDMPLEPRPDLRTTPQMEVVTPTSPWQPLVLHSWSSVSDDLWLEYSFYRGRTALGQFSPEKGPQSVLILCGGVWEAVQCPDEEPGYALVERELAFNLISIDINPNFTNLKITSDSGTITTTQAKQTLEVNWKAITWFKIEFVERHDFGTAIIYDVNMEIDVTPPVITPIFVGTLGENGWYVSDVEYSFVASDPESRIENMWASQGVLNWDTGRDGFAVGASAWSAGGSADHAAFWLRRDATKPEIKITGNKGTYRTNEAVSITCIATDPSSGIARQCESYERAAGTLTPGSHIISFEAKDVAGNKATANTVFEVEQADLSPPEINADVRGIKGNDGWYTSVVDLSWNVADAQSAISNKDGCGDVKLTEDTAGRLFECRATSEGGNASKTETIKRDGTAPVINYRGNAGAYTVDQTVTITCEVTDAMSDVASHDCTGVNKPAYELLLKPTENRLSSRATDRAGNVGMKSETFTVSVTFTSLGKLVDRFVSNAGVASGLKDKLDAAAASAARGNQNAKAGQLGAFENQINAQTGKAISAANAALLIRLVRAL